MTNDRRELRKFQILDIFIPPARHPGKVLLSQLLAPFLLAKVNIDYDSQQLPQHSLDNQIVVLLWTTSRLTNCPRVCWPRVGLNWTGKKWSVLTPFLAKTEQYLLGWGSVNSVTELASLIFTNISQLPQPSPLPSARGSFGKIPRYYMHYWLGRTGGPPLS